MIDIVLYVLSFLGVFILVVNFSIKSSNFVDIRFIVRRHFSIFRKNKLQFFSIYIIPVIFSITIGKNYVVNDGILDNLNIILSILISMFFAVLSILCSVDLGTKKDEYKQLVRETFESTIFEIVLCLLLLFVSFIVLFIGKYDVNVILQVVSSVIYYLTFIVILNILVIIKRIQVIFDYQ